MGKAMHITRACDYACRALVYLARNGPGAAETAKIAETIDVPPIYLRKIFQALSRAGLVRTAAGSGGGVALAAPADLITLKDIIEAVEGPIVLSDCIEHPETCDNAATCKVCTALSAIQAKLQEDFASRRLCDLV